MDTAKKRKGHGKITSNRLDETKEVFTLQEAAVLLDVTYKDVCKLVLTGELEAKKYGTKYLISKDDIKWFVFQRELEREN